MYIADIVNNARLKLDDVVEPYLWSDDEIAEYLNISVEELCNESYMIKDSTTDDICTINITADTAYYPLSDKITSIIIAKLDSMTNYLKQIDDGVIIDYDGSAITTPSFSYNDSSITLYPTPAANDTLHLTVYRLPLNTINMANAYNEIEVPRKWQNYLYYGIFRLAYDKNASDAYDPQMRDRYAAQWEITKDKILRESIRSYKISRRIVPMYGAM